MPAEVKILVEGQTNYDSVAETGQESTSPTISLVKDGNIIMVVDPGILESQQVLVDALGKEKLTVKDVNTVCITHSHIDHYRNIGMFPNAKTLEYYGLWDKRSVVSLPENFTPNIQVLHTPGHDYTGITLFVKTKNGVVAICGDNFWKESYPYDSQDDAFASNPKKLQESRDLILKMADLIIPGHGPMFKNDKTGEANKIIKEAADREAQVKPLILCGKCGRAMRQQDKCQCRPWLCFRCCQCGLDCDVCNCSRKADWGI